MLESYSRFFAFDGLVHSAKVPNYVEEILLVLWKRISIENNNHVLDRVSLFILYNVLFRILAWMATYLCSCLVQAGYS